METLDVKNLIYNIDDNELRDRTALEIQKLKVPLLVNLAKEILTNNLTSKIIIVLDFDILSKIISQELSDYNPIIYDSRNHTLIDKFAVNNLDLRILIMKPYYLQGLSLIDTTGNFPRFLLQISYGHLENSICRITRYGAKGTATVRFIWGSKEEFDRYPNKYPIEY
jgi:hypothetical protein